MPKYMIYKKNREVYLKGKIVFCDVRDGSVLQPDMGAGYKEGYEHNQAYLVTDAYPEKKIVAIKLTEGKTNPYMTEIVKDRKYSETEVERLEAAIKEFEADPIRCLTKYYPFKKYIKVAAIDPSSWRIAPGCTNSPEALAWMARLNAPLPPFRGDPHRPQPASPPISSPSSWPANIVTQEMARATSWSTHPRRVNAFKL